MKTLLLATLIALGAAPAANAESFTFTSTSALQNGIVVPVQGGKPVEAAFISGTSKATYASGRATTSTFQCASWSSTPGSIFDAYSACTYTEGGANATILAGCSFTDAARTESDCWGAISGLDGARKGKTGSMTWHARPSADGKTGVSNGVGQWND